jgi:hypothetical protein
MFLNSNLHVPLIELSIYFDYNEDGGKVLLFWHSRSLLEGLD